MKSAVNYSVIFKDMHTYTQPIFMELENYEYSTFDVEVSIRSFISRAFYTLMLLLIAHILNLATLNTSVSMY